MRAIYCVLCSRYHLATQYCVRCVAVGGAAGAQRAEWREWLMNGSQITSYYNMYVVQITFGERWVKGASMVRLAAFYTVTHFTK